MALTKKVECHAISHRQHKVAHQEVSCSWRQIWIGRAMSSPQSGANQAVQLLTWLNTPVTRCIEGGRIASKGSPLFKW